MWQDILSPPSPAVSRSSRHVPTLGQVRGALLGYPGRGRNRTTGDRVREGHREKGALRTAGEGEREPVQDKDSSPEVWKGGSHAGGHRKKE